MNNNVLNFLILTGLSMIAIGIGMWLKPLEIWLFLKPLLQLDPHISQLTVLSIGKIFIVLGIIALLLNLLLMFFDIKPSKGI